MSCLNSIDILQNGLLFVNNDDNLLLNLSKNIKKITYGKTSKSNISINGNTPFLNLNYNKNIIKSNLIGDYQFYNIALAICVGEY